MGKASKYSVNNDPSISDLLFGFKDGKEQNVPIEAVINILNSVAGKDYIQYKFSPADFISVGSFTSNGSKVNPAEITKLFLNKKSTAKEDLSVLFNKLDTLQNIALSLRNPSDANNFVTFKVTNITTHTDYFEFDVVLYKNFYSGNLLTASSYSMYFDVKENFEDKTNTGGSTKTAQELDTDIQTRVEKVTGKSLVSDTEITKLSHLDDTTDLQKPVSTAQQVAIDAAVQTQLVDSTLIGGVTEASAVPPTGNIHAIGVGEGTYPNWGGMVIPTNNIGTLQRVGGVYSVSLSPYVLPDAKINPWTATTYASGKQTSRDGKFWEANTNTLSTDIPGISSKWDEMLSGYTNKKEFYKLIGEDQVVNYPIDFTNLNSDSGANNTYINKIPVKKGVLTSFRVKAKLSSEITVYVYEITGTNGSYVFTLKHTYTPFTATSIEDIYAISDNYVIETGEYIGYKSSLGSSYGVVGTAFEANNPNEIGLTLSYDFSIKEYPDPLLLSTEFKRTLATLDTVSANVDSALVTMDLENVVQNTKIGLPITTNYPIDFVTLNSNGGAGNTYINSAPIVTKGTLDSLRVKTTIGSTVEIFVYNVNGSDGTFTFSLLKTYASFVTTALEHTQSITDSYELPIGSFIGVKSSSNIFFEYNATTLAFYGFQVGNPAYQKIKVSYDFKINYVSATSLETRLSVVENNMGIVPSGGTRNVLRSPVMYLSNIDSISDFTAVNWSLASGGGAIPSGVGSANHLWLKKRYNVKQRAMSIEVSLLSDSVFYIHASPLDYNQGSGFFAIDVPNNSLKIYDSNSVLKTSGTISFSVVSGRKYTITLALNDLLNSFYIKDSFTSQTYQLDYAITTASLDNENRQNDSYKFYLNSGATNGVKIHKISIASSIKPVIWLAGDSITEGVTLSDANYPNVYSKRLQTRLPNKVLISARGGAVLNDISEKIETELKFLKPDYAILTIGTNGGLNSGALTTAVNRIFELGIVPILNHVPNLFNGGHIVTNNTIDAVCASTGAIRGCLFDVATSIGNNPANSYVVANYSDSGIHPNSAGHLEMFKRFEIDLPFLFV